MDFLTGDSGDAADALTKIRSAAGRGVIFIVGTFDRTVLQALSHAITANAASPPSSDVSKVGRMKW